MSLAVQAQQTFTTATTNNTMPIPSNATISAIELTLPPTAGTEKATIKISFEQAKQSLQEKQNQGFAIPAVLKKTFDFIEMVTQYIVAAVGILLKYAGLFFIVAGGIHFVMILMTTPLSLIMTNGLVYLIFELIKRGALPTIISGAIMYSLGHNLITNNNIGMAAGGAAWALPLPFYGWLAQLQPPNPFQPK